MYFVYMYSGRRVPYKYYAGDPCVCFEFVQYLSACKKKKNCFEVDVYTAVVGIETNIIRFL